jgi:5,5'-dehydrodivanillate O-demethylase
MRLFWQPVYRADDLAPGRAVPIEIMSEKFTLYRGQTGAPHLLEFRCAHRGTQLSAGWVEEECIRCRYHGWKYDGAGQCVEQPGEDESFAAKVRIRTYPVREYLGLIFAYLGEGAPPAFRRYADFEKPGVLVAYPPEQWPCNYFNRLDNDADDFHPLFTHRESFLRTNSNRHAENRRLAAEETEYGVLRTIFVDGNPPQHFHAHMPNSNQLRLSQSVVRSATDSSRWWEDRITWAVPVDDDNSLRFEVNLVHLTGVEAEAYLRQYREVMSSITSPNELGEAILAGKLRIEDLDPRLSRQETFRVEDYVTEVGQGRIADRSQERLGRIDVGLILRRKLWERELKALSGGRPLKQWVIPEGLADESVIPPEVVAATKDGGTGR